MLSSLLLSSTRLITSPSPAFLPLFVLEDFVPLARLRALGERAMSSTAGYVHGGGK